MERFSPMEGHCKCCGQCCSAIFVKVSWEQILADAQKDGASGLSMLESDAIFAAAHWTKLTQEEALRRVPSLRSFPGWREKAYYSCSFHQKNKLCSLDMHGQKKPKICKGYPWYGKKPNPSQHLHPGCGYTLDKIFLDVNLKEEKVMSLNLEELEVGVQEVVDYTRFSGVFAQSLREVVQRKITAQAAREQGLKVTDEELQQAADIFRAVNNLGTVGLTETWLKERGLTLDALENYLETNLLLYKFKADLEEKAPKEKYLESHEVKEVIQDIAYRDWLVTALK